MITPKQMLAGQRRRLKRIKRELEDMSAEWDEVDQCNLAFLAEAANKVQEVSDLLIYEEAQHDSE